VTLSIVQASALASYRAASTVAFLTLPNHLRTDGTADADPDA